MLTSFLDRASVCFVNLGKVLSDMQYAKEWSKGNNRHMENVHPRYLMSVQHVTKVGSSEKSHFFVF